MRRRGFPQHAYVDRRGDVFMDAQRIIEGGSKALQVKHVAMLMRVRLDYLRGWPQDTMLKPSVVQELWKTLCAQFCEEPEAQEKIMQKLTAQRALVAAKKGKGGPGAGKSQASSDAAAASSDPAGGKAGKRQRGVSDFKRMIFESALFNRYGGKTWTR